MTGTELQRQMKSLDFTLVEPAMMKEMNMHIVGARYTTLGGEMAAQIAYVDSHGVPCTSGSDPDVVAEVGFGTHR